MKYRRQAKKDLTKLIEVCRKTKLFEDYFSNSPRNFSIPAILIAKCHSNHKLWQLRLSIYSYIKYFRSGYCPTESLIKRLPKVFQSSFQSNRRAAVLQAIDILVADGIVVRVGSGIQLVNIQDIVVNEFEENGFLEKYRKQFFSFSDQENFFEQFKNTFSTTRTLILALVQSLEIRDTSHEKQLALGVIQNGQQPKGCCDTKLITKDDLFKQGYIKLSASVIIKAANLKITANHLYSNFSKCYADETLSKTRTAKIIACTQKFFDDCNKKSFYSDIDDAKIDDCQKSLADFFSYLSYKQQNGDLDFHPFVLRDKKGNIRAICQTAPFFRKVNSVSNLKTKVKLNKYQKTILKKRTVVQDKNYEVYFKECKKVQAVKVDSFEDQLPSIQLNDSLLISNKIKQLDFSERLKICSDYINVYNTHLGTNTPLEFIFENEGRKLTFTKDVVKRESGLVEHKRKKSETFFQTCERLNIHCSFLDFKKEDEEFNKKIYIHDILKKMLKRENQICKTLKVTIGMHNIDELRMMYKNNKVPLTEKAKYAITKSKERKFYELANKGLTKLNLKLTVV